MRDDFICSVTTKAFTTFKLKAVAVDEYTVDITADRPAPILDLGFAVYPMMSPKTELTTLTRNPIGTGPYVLKEWTSGVQVVLDRNLDYWGEQPQVSQVTYVFRNATGRACGDGGSRRGRHRARNLRAGCDQPQDRLRLLQHRDHLAPYRRPLPALHRRSRA